MKAINKVVKKINQTIILSLKKNKVSIKILNQINMRTIVFFLSLSLWLFTAPANTLCVNTSGQGSGIWTNPYNDLQTAINNASSGDEIWVAAGTYSPSSPANGSTDFRDNTFFIDKSITIYGGFVGNETSLSQRNLNLVNNPSILNGIITNGTNIYHAYHVLLIVSQYANVNVTLDGFVIENGDATGNGIPIINSVSVDRRNGGGIFHYGVNLTIQNSIITNNEASSDGGGIYTENGTLIISYTKIINNGNHTNANAMNTYGGGIYCLGSVFDLTSVLIADNMAAKGGGIHIETTKSGYSSFLNNVTISNNTASSGSELFLDDPSAIVRISNSIIWGYGSGADIPTNNYFLCASCLIQNPNIYSSPNAPNLPDTTNPLFIAPFNGDYHLQFNSPCRDRGRGSVSGVDLDGNPRTCGNIVDMGAYEYTVMPDANGIVYVKKGSTGNGSSWNNATGELSVALHFAQYNSNIHQIWVAQGTYTPFFAADGSSTDPKDQAFVLVDNVSIYGGFPYDSDNGITMNHRNWQTYPTILSGYSTTYHVIISAGNSSSKSIDGFIITNGKASGTGNIQVNGHTIPRNNGGGIYVSSFASFNNLEILSCYAANNGGGIYVTAPANFHNSKVLNCQSANDGGGIYVSSSASFKELRIEGCQAANKGGGLYNKPYSATKDDNIILDKVWIMNNEAIYGGGIYMQGTDTHPICIWRSVSIIGNEAHFGGGMYNESVDPVLLNFYICGNYAEKKGSAIFNKASSPQYYNTLIAQNEMYVGGDTDDAVTGKASIYNEDSSPEFHNTTIAMCIPNGIGIINYNVSYPYLCNTIIWSDNLLQGGQQPVIDKGGATTTYHHCLIQDRRPSGNNLPAGTNPDFINFVATSNYQTNYGDYHLMPNSQCIDWGDHPCIATYTSLGDLDYNRRVLAQTDLGCYEFDPARPNPPNNPYHKNMGNEDILPEENITTSNLSLKVYPNPIASSQQPALFFGEGNLYYEDAIDIKVYSLEGKQIHSKTYSTGNTILDIPQLSSGMYIVNVRTQEGKVYNSKLVITQ
jgi:hypothetical protein